MKFHKPFKEVYIRLVDNEAGFVCTTRYGGIVTTVRQFALKMSAAAFAHFDDDRLPVSRTINHLSAGPPERH